MKNIFKHISLFLVFISTNLFAQTPTLITKPESPNLDYIVTQSETLVASQSIILKPNTWIKSGSTFIARISADAYIPTTLSNQNYIFTRSFQKEMANPSDIATNADVNESISYFDGLGRPMQNIAIKASPSKQDIVTHIDYDDFGRQDKDYLPYLAETGAIASYRTDAETNTNNYYVTHYSNDINSATPNPYSQKKFDDSPLNRIMLQAAPGSAWALNSGHEIKMDYQTNVANEVKFFTAINTWDSVRGIFQIELENATGTTFYGAGTLYKTVTKDENWISRNENTTEEFKNKDGRIILKRTYGTSIVNNNAESVVHDTYYVYDIYGNLTYVLPPKADGAIDASVLSNLCYQYRYDSRNRLVEKKIPGKEWEFIVYDQLDRPVLTQDSNLREQNKWIFTKYDTFSRPVYTGEYVNTTETSRAAIQMLASESTLFENRAVQSLTIGDIAINYTNNAFPKSSITPFTITYYDDYNNIDLDGGTTAVSYDITPITNAKGLTVASKIRILETSLWTTNVNYYDNKGREIYTYSKNNYLTAINTVKKQLDFVGKVLETTSTHQKSSGSAIIITDTFAYDHAGRLISQKQKINGQTQETISANTYDNLGQLNIKDVGGTVASLQTVNYKYNIRGWLKSINDINAIGNDLFAFQINYNNITNNDVSTPLFNGNISETFWKTANIDTSLKSYTYGYDELNRLIYAIGESDDQQELASYDKNGNIMSMYRTGIRPKNTGSSKKVMQILDNLTYTYDQGNKLIKVEDSADSSEGFKNGANLPVEYSYDDNGNMKTDANKGINTNIAYNYLNLPTQITLPGGTISYVYDATGIKQRKIVGTITTDYSTGFQYENNLLQFFPQPEGYVSNNNGVFEYIYQYKDHLGNVRLSYNKNLNIVEENNYYPFGLKQTDNNNVVNSLGNAAANKYKYNGKELQDELGLNFYDYGARNYDSALGRWMNIDPLAEKTFNFSPYTYAVNNPVYFIDPDGKEIDISLIYKKDKNGKEIRDKDGNRTLTNVNITITGKVINFSDNNVDMDKAVSDITTSLEKSFSGAFGDAKVKATANFSVANSMNDVKDSDHLLVLTEKIKPQFDKNGQMTGEPFGISNFFGGKVAFVDADYFTGFYDKYIGNQGERTAAHEFGHLFGLEHEMGGLMQGGGAGTNLTDTQFGTIIKSYKAGKLNYGTNATIYGLPNSGIIPSEELMMTNTNGRAKKRK
ncbi:DUF6443 domain-containing protein [Flavobacterium sp. C3NV]|uniref:DUF6443 domain-containing protein n=1 Tax=Flavobacterium sp. C3NV TaxID=3393358 RepID=UPI00398FD831